jgi:uridine kinase
VVEGIFALHDDVSLGDSLAVFVDASTHGRALRRLLRDIQRTPMTAHEILDYFFSVVEPMHRKHIQSTVSNADIIINNDYDAPSESLRAPNREKQTKIKIANSVDIVPLLEKLGATHMMHTSQYDTYFETDVGKEEIVRIRKE